MSSDSFSDSSSGYSYEIAAPLQQRSSYAAVAAGGARDGSTTSAHPPSATAMSGRDGRTDSSRSAALATSVGVPHHQEHGGGHERRPGTSSGPTGAGWASDAARYGIERTNYHDDGYVFFTPSYLASSRHVQRLGHAYDEYMAHLDEQASRNGQRQPPLSASSSSANLSKMSSYRAPVQDVIERFPPASSEYEEKLHPLPSKWSDTDKMNGLEIMADGTEVRFNGVTKSSDEAAAVRSDHPMPRECGIYYFEVTILSRGKDGLIGIGFSSRKANLNRLPGWENESWAYHGDDGYVFACTASGKAYGPRFAAQDVIGCGVNFRTGNAFFTKNGNYLGNAFNGIRGDRLFPSVGMKKPGEHLRINFGKAPFVFDIDRMAEQERQVILADISKSDISTLHPPDDESALVHNLIGQYLAHEGYVETAKAFARDVQDREQSLSDASRPTQLSSEGDDIHANNRQKIRRSILDGDIDRALKYTRTYYPPLFEDERNKDIYFKLRCRKFIETMRRYTELVTAASSPMTVTKSVESIGSNGHLDVTDEELDMEDPPDTQMELDDQLHRETSRSLEPPNNDDVDMDTSQELLPKLSYMKADQLLSHALGYGQELKQEFGKDPRPEVQKQLQDIFATVAYTNLSHSPLSYLFDSQGRSEIAEAVNGAILVSLGKPSSAALEKLCAQTEALLDEVALRTGGAAAMINVRKDFLQE